MSLTRSTNIRIGIAFVGVTLASMAGAVVSGKQAGESGAKAGRAEVQLVAKQYAYQITTDFVKRQREGCVRSNKRTEESNRRVVLHERQDRAIALIGMGARQARLRSYAKTHEQLDIDAVNNFYEPAIDLVKSVKFTPLPLVDCVKSYPLPVKP